MIFSRRATLLAASAVISILLVIYYNLPNHGRQVIYMPETKETKVSHRTNKTKNILYYTKMFDDLTFYMGEGRQIFQNCPVKDCFATHDRDTMPIDQFDALLFHANQFNPFGDKVPNKRSTDQIYIWVNMESPPNSINYKTDNFYNWSMTYRLDSEIWRYYGYITKQKTNYVPPTEEEVQKKTKKIAWAVSNCKPFNARDKLSKAINKLVPVDVYGRCGDKVCRKEEDNKCFEKYKFYFSFENSNCLDYVTEKIYKILQMDLIPIVYGGANYSNFVPPHSVIDVSQYDSVQELVDYLKVLDEDPKKYLKYFEWKKDYVISMDPQRLICSICEKLHQTQEHMTYKDMNSYYDYAGVCKYGKNLPKIVADLL